MKTKLHAAFGLRPSAFTGIGTALVTAITLFTTTPRALAQSSWGTALSFDGVDDYVEAGAVPLANSSFTLETWARRHSATNMDYILGQGGLGNSHCLGFGYFISQFVFGFYGDELWTTNTYTDTDWHHWAGTYDANTKARCLYRDGMLVASNTASANYQGSGPLIIGKVPWSSGTEFNGEIDDVRIWSVARSQADIVAQIHYPLTGAESNLLACWKFDEGAGTNVLDATTNGYNGTLVNGPKWTPSTVPLWGNALSLNGTNQYVALPSGTWFGNAFTIETWVYMQSYGSSARVIDFGNGTSDEVILALSTGTTGRPYFQTTPGGQYVSPPNPIPTNQWVHLAATLTNNTGTLYVNGVAMVSGTVTAPNAVNRTNNYIGRSNWSGDSYANAIFDDLRIWNVARTAGQIQDGMCHPFSGTESNLVGYWKFDEVSGNLAHDSTGYHRDGALVNTPVWTNSTIPAFVNVDVGLPGIQGYAFDMHAVAAWADYDNDGRLDVLLMGTTNGVVSGETTFLLRNTTNGFTKVNAGLPNFTYGSATWGDYNNDGLLDILLTGWLRGGSIVSQLWRNNGNGTFAYVNSGLPAVWFGAAAWGDYDNDGRPDLLIAGGSSTDRISCIAQIWHNNGDGTFTNINAGLPGLVYPSVAWGDYDNDGRLDLLLTGATNYDTGLGITQLWHNNGDGTFSNVNAGLPAKAFTSVAWGDYDNDGRLDILLGSEVWRNTGDGTFSNINAGLAEISLGSAAVWGDYDNDGRLDILLSGYIAAGQYITDIWRNQGDGTFQQINAGLPGLEENAVAWGDYDNDGRLDALLVGWLSDNNPQWSRVCRNLGIVTNTPPTAPTNLAANLAGHRVTLTWSAGSDVQTPVTGLSYNIRVGTAPGASDLISPQAAVTNGFRRLPALGNAQAARIACLKDLPYAMYYWSAQAVDTAFAGSPFAPEQRFAVAAQTLPATAVGLTTATFNGTNYPFGLTNTSWFEWGDTANYGHTTPPLQLSGTSPVPVSAVVTGLVLFNYQYRLVITNELGPDFGSNVAVAMQLAPPQLLTQTATNSAPTSTVLQGMVNPSERDTVAWFEYGLDTRYGQVSTNVDVGGGPNAVPVGIPVNALVPWMTYHYRILASNSVGVTVGSDATVTLPGPSVTAPSLWGLHDVPLPQGGSNSVWFTVSPPSLDVQVRCSNPVLLPAGGLTLGGSGSSRSLAIVPAASYSGSAVVTVTASDGSSSVSSAFNLTVTPSAGQAGSLLYLTNAQVVSTQAWRFRLVDAGTGSTNYEVEYRPDLSPTNVWAPATNVTALPGRVFEVTNGPPQRGLGFYRAKGFRLLMANLDSAALTVEKGAGPAGPVLVFNGIYTGTVTCIWTDQQGTSWTSQVQVNGTTAVIPVPASYLAENASIGQLQYLTLQMQGGTSFALDATTQSTVMIKENNAEWQGVLQTLGGTLDFGLTLIQNNGSLQGQIQSDGFGFFPTNALVQLNYTEDAFTAVATSIPLPTLTAYPPLGFTNYLDLRLDGTNVSPTQIQGTATLVSRAPNRSYLDAAVYGTFQLLKPPTAPSTNQVPLYTNGVPVH